MLIAYMRIDCTLRNTILEISGYFMSFDSKKKDDLQVWKVSMCNYLDPIILELSQDTCSRMNS